MVQITVDIDDELLERLKERALRDKSYCSDLAQKYIKQGIDNMSTVSINEDIMEKINIRCKQVDSSPEDLVNYILFNHLREVEEIPDKIDIEKIWNMLEHDKPEGDDILQRLLDLSE